MKNVSISIIIPVYNVEKYIVSCLNSVIAQTFKKGVECILVDDCGNDRSLDVIYSFFKRNECDMSKVDVYLCHGMEFRILHHERNKGLSAARNTGISAARGDYMFFLDSDDELTSNCLEEMWKIVEKCGKLDLIQGAFTEVPSYINKALKRPFEEYTDDLKLAKACLLSYDINPITAQNRLVRRLLIIDNKIYFKEGIIHEDNHWTFFLAKYVSKMAICKIPTYMHRYNPDSITHKRDFLKEKFAYRTLIEDFSSNIDSVLSGHQKELILNTLLIALNLHYFDTIDDRNRMISLLQKQHNFIENCLFFLFRISKGMIKEKLLHILYRVYNSNEHM